MSCSSLRSCDQINTTLPQCLEQHFRASHRRFRRPYLLSCRDISKSGTTRSVQCRRQSRHGAKWRVERIKSGRRADPEMSGAHANNVRRERECLRIHIALQQVSRESSADHPQANALLQNRNPLFASSHTIADMRQMHQVT